MAVKFIGNPVFECIREACTDLMEDLNQERLTDFLGMSTLPPYHDFTVVYGRLYDGCSDRMIANELGWQYLRRGYVESSLSQEGLTPPAAGVRDDVMTLWLNRFIIEAISLYRGTLIFNDVFAEFLKSVPVLVAGAITAVLGGRAENGSRSDLIKPKQFFDYASSDWNQTADMAGCGLSDVEGLILKAIDGKTSVSRRMFFVRVCKWMATMFNRTHPLADKHRKFSNALRQIAIETIFNTLSMNGASIGHRGKSKAELESSDSDDPTEPREFEKFKFGLLAEVVAEWNCAPYYTIYTADVLIHTAFNNDMIAADLYAYRHRILDVYGDEALHSQY